MNSRREQVWTGLFVIVATVLVIAVVLSVSGTFGEKGVTYRAYFKFASGLANAAPVRYGGFLAGKVERLRVDPGDSTRIEIDFLVNPGIPVKTDSVARITALGALGENYLEISTGTKDSPLAKPGSVLRSHETMQIADLGDLIGGIVPSADQVLKNINDRVTELKVTIASVNELLNEPNRNNISASLVSMNALLADTRPKMSATLTNVQTATGKLPPVMDNVKAATDKMAPLLDDMKLTIKQANDALGRVDSMVAENRPDVRASMETTRKTLETASQLVELLKATMDRNTENLDDTLLNVREATENLKDLTDTLKRNPSVLIRGETSKDRQPGGNGKATKK